MKLKSINKILTAVLSVSMLMGSTMPVLASDGGEVDVEAPIYSYDIIDVIVPTTYAVAFNPDSLPVVTEGSTTSNAQILSRNYGIINKSSKDKVITVKLNVKDLNEDSSITFVDSANDATSAADGEYKIYLTAIPADTTEVKVGDASATKTTAAADLDNVTMETDGSASKAVTLKGGDNYLGFKLSKAEWEAKSDNQVTLGSTTSNDVSANYDVKELASGGAGITAFTFGGAMNANADWFKLTKGIKISAVYSSETAPSGLSAVSGTGAMVEPNVAPTFSTGKEIGQINYSAGAGDNGIKEIQKIEITFTNGTAYDVYHALGTSWGAATVESGVITLDPKVMTSYKGTANKLEATVTYETNAGETKTATVIVKRVIVDEAPAFTTGSGIGKINYTMGEGNKGLKEITKIEVTFTDGKVYDVYNARSTTWGAATVESGVITLDSGVMSSYKGTQSTVEATVTYVTNSGETGTATVTVNFK